MKPGIRLLVICFKKSEGVAPVLARRAEVFGRSSGNFGGLSGTFGRTVKDSGRTAASSEGASEGLEDRPGISPGLPRPSEEVRWVSEDQAEVFDGPESSKGTATN